MRLLSLTVAAVLMATAAQAQDADLPAECRGASLAEIDFIACEAATPEGSPARSWARINLGTQAYLRGDFANAVRYYDAAIPPSGEIYSDAMFHAFRGSAYDRVGRTEEGLKDARLAAQMMLKLPTLPPQARAAAAHQVAPEPVYGAILPILKRGNAPEFEPALAAYMALTPDRWEGYLIRSDVRMGIGDLNGALADSQAALNLAPDHFATLNNHCYFLVQAKRAAEGLPLGWSGPAVCRPASQLRRGPGRRRPVRPGRTRTGGSPSDRPRLYALPRALGLHYSLDRGQLDAKARITRRFRPQLLETRERKGGDGVHADPIGACSLFRRVAAPCYLAASNPEPL